MQRNSNNDFNKKFWAKNHHLTIISVNADDPWFWQKYQDEKVFLLNHWFYTIKFIVIE